MGRRHDVPPGEQLESLRKARDHYYALADSIHDTGRDPFESVENYWKREREARRLAAAYDNSFNIQRALIHPERR